MTIDASLQPYLDTWKAAWQHMAPDAPISARRAMLEKLATEARKPLPDGVTSEVVTIEGGPRPVRVRLFRPTAPGLLPAMAYMHGGGWMQGSPETHDEIAAFIAAETGHLVASVDYALAPENPFPAAVEDCAAVVRWLFAQAHALRVRPDAISVGGDSAGANLAASMTLMFRGTAQALRAQVLFYPAVDFTHDRPSVRENADGPIITAKSLPGTAALYLPDPADRTNPLAAPMLASDHAHLPPAYIAVAEHDPLRDEGKDYAAALRTAGVPVDLHDGKGLFHGYLRAMSLAAVAKAPLEQACAWLKAQVAR
ncbi:alpha/beta hydrolase [uncultured Alsobacter sp.]|uniref:alpha/beta hydrolase n=1 Tax=uncultured Alsobacter sp. TaxID=1748258 RepID=UPI0025DC3EFF|nr:alpha/beta hydrolase [uncultured Alsobacter sp.]